MHYFLIYKIFLYRIKNTCKTNKILFLIKGVFCMCVKYDNIIKCTNFFSYYFKPGRIFNVFLFEKYNNNNSFFLKLEIAKYSNVSRRIENQLF